MTACGVLDCGARIDFSNPHTWRDLGGVLGCVEHLCQCPPEVQAPAAPSSPWAPAWCETCGKTLDDTIEREDVAA